VRRMGKHTNWVWIFIILSGLVVGGLLGELFGTGTFSFLSYGKEFGISGASPMVLDFYIFRLVFGLTIKINIASIIGVLLSMLIYKLVRK
jgi:hypothetical protein